MPYMAKCSVPLPNRHELSRYGRAELWVASRTRLKLAWVEEGLRLGHGVNSNMTPDRKLKSFEVEVLTMGLDWGKFLETSLMACANLGFVDAEKRR